MVELTLRSKWKTRNTKVSEQLSNMHNQEQVNRVIALLAEQISLFSPLTTLTMFAVTMPSS
jgi:hypothetical protein